MPSNDDRDIVFAVTAGGAYGLGHLMRCVALAREAAGTGLKTAFLLESGESDFPVLKKYLPDVPVSRWNRPQLEPAAAGVVVFDARGDLRESLVLARRKGIHTVLIDRTDVDPHLADRVILPGLHETESTGPRVLRGVEYVILSDLFTSFRPPPYPGGREDLLISMGGSDPHHLTEKVLKACIRKRSDLKGRGVRFVLGPVNPGRDTLLRAIEEQGFSAVSAPSQEEFRDLMSKALLAVIGFGISVYETAYMGTPAIWIAHHRQDESVAGALEARGLGWSIGYGPDVDVEVLASKIVFCLNHPEALVETSRIGPLLLSRADGARKIVQECRSLLETH